MSWFPLEFLVWGGLFVAMLVLNFVMQRAAARKRVPPPAGRPQQPAAVPPGRPSAAELWGQLRKITEAAEAKAAARAEWVEVPPEGLREIVERDAPAPAAPVAPPRRRPYTRRNLLGSRSDLRKAIVLMTVLGPCRGAESAQRGQAIEEPPPR